MSACPLLRCDRIIGCLFLGTWRQDYELSHQHAADNLLGPVDTREDFHRLTRWQWFLFYRDQRICPCSPDFRREFLICCN